MTWMYHEIANDDVKAVIAEIDKYLNLLNTNLNVKFDVCNAQKSLARGVVFYEEAKSNKTSAARPAAVAPAGAPLIAWNQYTWSTPADYEWMYQSFTDVLNTGKVPDNRVISMWQVENARCVLTNAHEGDATLSIYYPAG